MDRADATERTDQTRGQVAAEAAQVYEEFFVPALFGQWAEPVLDAAGVRAGDRVLDVGCGTGVLARAAAARVGERGEVAGLDRNDGMLAVARRSPERVDWRAGRAEALPWDEARFDRVLSQFALMFLDDRALGLREIARVVAPGGSVAVATWCSADTSPGYASMIGLLDDIAGPTAADALRAPFSIGTPEVLCGLMAPTFPQVVVRRYDGVARFASIEAWLHTDIRGWTLAGLIDDTTYGRLLDAARRELGRYTGPDGTVRFAAPALIATAEITT